MKRFLLSLLLTIPFIVNAQNDLLSIHLNEVLIESSPIAFERLGSSVYSFSQLGYWQDKEAIGGELATRINVPNRRSRLKNLRFFVLKNESDSVEVAIKVYAMDKNMPGELLYEHSIKKSITENRGEVLISLEPYDIVVDDDVVIGIALVNYHGEKLHFALSATPHGGTAYLREKNDNWDVRWNLGLAFGLLSSYPVDNRISAEKP